MARNAIVAVGIVALTFLVGFGIYGFISRSATAKPVVVQAPLPVSDVSCGETYEVDRLERFYISGRVAVNFTFGGLDRNLRPQYIWDKNVIGQSTEIRSRRRVDRSLAYSLVTFLCQSDLELEGHKISNVRVMRYRLTLRQPLRQQKVIRKGGPARH